MLAAFIVLIMALTKRLTFCAIHVTVKQFFLSSSKAVITQRNFVRIQPTRLETVGDCMHGAIIGKYLQILHFLHFINCN